MSKSISKIYNFTFDDDYSVKSKNGNVKLRLHTKEEFFNWLRTASVFQTNPSEISLKDINDGIFIFAYKMYEHALKVHNGDILPTKDEEVNCDYNIGFQNTAVVNQVTEIGMRQQKTIYDGDVDKLFLEKDFYTPDLLNVKGLDGELEITKFKGESEKDLNSLFLTCGWVYLGFQLFSCVPQLSIEEIMNTSIVKNPEMRARILFEPHVAKLLSTMLGDPVDVYVNEKYKDRKDVYRLFKGQIGEDSVTYVNCFCPTTNREFMLGVKNKYTNVRDAVASLLEMPEKTLQYVDKIFRQGEVFAVSYKGIDTKSNKFRKANESKLVPPSGDFYFDKMAFES